MGLAVLQTERWVWLYFRLKGGLAVLQVGLAVQTEKVGLAVLLQLIVFPVI